MTIIEKIKQSVEGATGMPFLYHAAGEINELIARCGELPVAYSFLIDSGTIDDVNGRYHERVTIAVMFCDKTAFDFNAIENEEIIDRMKVKAYKWMQSLRMSNALRVVSVNNTQRLYDNTTDVLTGFAVNITIEDIAGVGECELPDVVIDVDKNGTYDVVGVDKVRVNVQPILEELEVTENGEYLPPTDIAGFSKVVANILPKMTDLVVTENDKEYLPSKYGVDAFGKVKTELRNLVKVSSLSINNDCINEEGRWGGDVLIDTSLLNGMSFEGCTNLKYIDCSYWDTSNFTSLFYLFRGCKNLESIVGLNQFDTSKVIYIGEAFYNCTSLKELDISNWDTSNVKSMSATFRNCTSLKELDVSNLDTSKVTTMWYMFDNVKSVKGYENWNTSNVTNMEKLFGSVSNMRKIDLHNWDVRKVTTFNMFLYGTFYLEEIDITGWETPSVVTFNMITHGDILWTLLGGKGIDEVLQNDIYTLKGIKISFSLNKTIIDRASLRAVINGLADLTGQTAQTLTLGSTLIAKLAEEDIAIATNKNWTIIQ